MDDWTHKSNDISHPFKSIQVNYSMDKLMPPYHLEATNRKLTQIMSLLNNENFFKITQYVC